MNDHLFGALVQGFIPLRNRPILTRQDRWLAPARRQGWELLMADVFLHTGCPCARYCTCMFDFEEGDRIDAYRRRFVS